VRNNGETNPVTYLVLALVAAGLFYGYHVAPLYYDNLAARDIAGEAFAVYILKGEAAALDGLLIRANAKSPDTSHYEVDKDGVESVAPGYGLTEDNVKFTFDETTRKLTVRIEYDRIVEFKPLKKRKSYHLVAEKTGIVSK
jgi:hypothetical protein